MNERRRRMKLALSMLVTVGLLGLALLTRPTSGSHVGPVYVGYDATCADLAPPGAAWHELRIAPVADGVYADAQLTVSLDVHVGDDDDDDDIIGDGDDDDEGSTTVDWSSHTGIDGVFVKGGPGGYFYRYVPAAGQDSGLSAPRRFDDDDDDFAGGNGDGGHYDPEHILFCAVMAPTSTPPHSVTLTPSPTATPVVGTATPTHMTEQMYFPAVCHGCLVGPGEPNNACAAAHAIGVDTPYDFLAEDAGDWYRFQLTTAYEVEVHVENFVPLEGQVAAFAGANCETAAFLESNGDRALHKTLALGRQPAGTYYVFISNDGALNGAEPYRLVVETR